MGLLRSNFLPGLILGVGIGLLLGHATVWRQNHQSLRPLTSPAPLKVAGLSETSPRMPSVRDEFASGVGFDFQEKPEPLQNALALDSAVDVNQPPKNSLIPVSQPLPQPTSEPQQLPLGTAAPLSGNSKSDQETIRELIDLELSQLTPEQRRVWFESLKDVDKADAVGILKMWRMLGGSGAPLPTEERDSPFPKPSTRLDHPAVPTLAPTHLPPNLVSAARAIHRDNLLMANTPGYVPLVPVWYTSSPEETDEPMQLQHRLNLSETKRVPTGFPLDVAIVGAGFFQVTSAKGEEYYTRNGQFGLDEQLRICLTIAGQKLVLVPEVRLKGLGLATQSVEIQPSGEVILKQPDQDDIQAGVIHLAQPLSSASLKSCGNGLFQLSEGASGQVLRSPPAGDGYSHLVQEELEFPIIDAEAEAAAIEALGIPVN